MNIVLRKPETSVRVADRQQIRIDYSIGTAVELDMRAIAHMLAPSEQPDQKEDARIRRCLRSCFRGFVPRECLT